MLILSFQTLIEEAISEAGQKNLTGNIRSFEKLLEPENLERLHARFHGWFAFIAFHPGADQPTLAYVQEGTLASDSGPHVLVLFTTDAQAKWPTPLKDSMSSDWLNLDTTTHPSYEMVRWLFEPKAAPPLPGILFAESFSGEGEAIFISLGTEAK